VASYYDFNYCRNATPFLYCENNHPCMPFSSQWIISVLALMNESKFAKSL